MKIKRFFSNEIPNEFKRKSKLKLIGRIIFPLIFLIPYVIYVFKDRFQFHKERKEQLIKEHEATKARKAQGKVLE